MNSARTRFRRRAAALTGLLALGSLLAVAPAYGASLPRIWWDAASPATKTSGELTAVTARSATDVWAVGAGHLGDDESHAVVHHWNGTVWQTAPEVASEVLVRLTGVATLPSGEAIAVGSETSGLRTTPLIQEYAAGGGVARVLPGPIPAEGGAWQGIDLRSATDGWAVGVSGSLVEGEPARTLIAHWDGTGWQQVPSPSPGTLSSRLTAVTAVADDDAWAVGEVRNTGDAVVARSLLLHWDGSMWSQVDSPDPGAVRTTLLAVDAAGPGELWAVGYTLDTVTDDPDPDELLHAVALYRAGGAWRVLRSSQPTATEFTGVVVTAPREVVFASYRLVSGAESTNIEEWHGGALAPDSINPGTSGNEHIGSALSGIAAEPGGGRLWAVGWTANGFTGVQQPYSLRSQ
ncbi:hypothetical protein [Actinoplanes sp. NPDC026619]|uniref:hypothetical protein n=1 Tax=Actinoplanes sp. NPDC026619 TaxID=3155798 RepID=UPI003408C3FC